MIESLALRLAEGVKKQAPQHPASIAVLKHSIAILINTISIIVLTVLMGIFIGRIQEAALILIAFPLLRMASGGFHLKTGMMCVLVTTCLFTGLTMVELNNTLVNSFNITSVMLVLLFAPSGIEKSSRIPRKYYPLMKVISLCIVCSNFFIASPIIAACFLVQALTLISMKGGENK